MLNFVKIETHKFLNYYIIMVSYKELGLVNTREMFAKAIKGGYAIPAFNFNNMEQMQAIVQACVETSSPVIMQVSSGARKYANPTILRYMAQGAVEYAKELGKNIPIVLHLDHGDFVTIIGSNGAGKSTLFNAIAGSFYVDDGFIELDGEDITYMPEHKRSLMVGRLFQDPLKGTAPGMTIEENLALAYLRTAKGKSPFSRISKKDKDAFRERLSLLNMGLEDRMTQPVGLLSGGQRQALTLLMATLITPKLLLLDEHTAALDPGTAEKVLELTKNIVAEEKITCLMITHNMNQALELGNRTLMMANGNIVLDVGGAERASMTVEDLIARFKTGAGHALDNDRILLSE